MSEININTGDTSIRGQARRRRKSSSALVWLTLLGVCLALAGVVVFLVGQRSAPGVAQSAPVTPRPSPQSAPTPAPSESTSAGPASNSSTLSPTTAPAKSPPAATLATDSPGTVSAGPVKEPLAGTRLPNSDAIPHPEVDTSMASASAPAENPLSSEQADAEQAAAPRPGASDLRLLYDNGKLFRPRSYPAIRRIYAARFADDYAAEIEAALSEKTRGWLNNHAEIKEEFFTAIDPEHDEASAALAMFDRLRSEFPQALAEHWSLAVAVSVVWDDNRRAIYEYRPHQQRVKATLPAGQLAAVDNYRYLLDTDSGRYLPWEFLIYTVDHRTPLDERQWAVKTYLGKSREFGRCYRDVPYDHGLIQTAGEVAAMAGQAYTLPNLCEFGGVCAHQADFASRVGKSLGIPAVYAGGQASNQDHHAWVMWVELEAVGPGSIAFRLESSGRYRYDKYYVGQTRDPQTGQKITDRQLQLRLHTAGMNTAANRQARLVMAAYPELVQDAGLDVLGRLNYLSAVTELCPGNTAAWRELARLAGEENLTRGQRRVLGRGIDQLFTTFSGMPDFTWEVFEDLVRAEPELEERIGLYDRLIGMYVSAGRPDLASQARLKQVELYRQAGEPITAAQALAPTILAFADDGRYAPPMFDRLRQLCRSLEGGAEFLDAFYPKYLRQIPTHRGNTPSPYAIQMYRQAIDWYSARNRPGYVAELRRRLAALEAGDLRS